MAKEKEAKGKNYWPTTDKVNRMKRKNSNTTETDSARGRHALTSSLSSTIRALWISCWISMTSFCTSSIMSWSSLCHRSTQHTTSLPTQHSQAGVQTSIHLRFRFSFLIFVSLRKNISQKSFFFHFLSLTCTTTMYSTLHSHFCLNLLDFNIF